MVHVYRTLFRKKDTIWPSWPVESAHLNSTPWTWPCSRRFYSCPQLFDDIKRADIVKIAIVLYTLVETAKDNDLLVPIDGTMTWTRRRGAFRLDLLPLRVLPVDWQAPHVLVVVERLARFWRVLAAVNINRAAGLGRRHRYVTRSWWRSMRNEERWPARFLKRGRL